MSDKLREAIVLVGGLGTRLRPLVSDLPKPMAPVAGRPFLAWILDHLRENQTDRVILAAGYMATSIQEVFGQAWGGMALSYSIESSPLGTGGAVRKALSLLHGRHAHVVNGDTYLRYSLAGMELSSQTCGEDFSMALVEVDDVARYGAVEFEQGRAIGFSEKGRTGKGFINAGSYHIGPRAIAEFPEAEVFSLEQDVLKPAAMQGKVAVFTDTADFIDIGIPEDYLRAQAMFGVA